MTSTAFVTGADRGLGLALCAGLLERDLRVFAGRYMPDWPDLDELAEKHAGRLTSVPLDVSSARSAHEAARMVGEQTDRIDLLVNNAGVVSESMFRPIRETQDYGEMSRMLDVNALGPLRVVEAFLPLTDASEMRRLCFVSSEAASVARCERASWYGYCMSKAALNRGVKILFNDLRPQGYTFRLIHPGWIRSYMHGEKDLKADLEPEEAAESALEYFLSDLARQQEDRLAMHDADGEPWPW